MDSGEKDVIWKKTNQKNYQIFLLIFFLSFSIYASLIGLLVPVPGGAQEWRSGRLRQCVCALVCVRVRARVCVIVFL